MRGMRRIFIPNARPVSLGVVALMMNPIFKQYEYINSKISHMFAGIRMLFLLRHRLLLPVFFFFSF